MKNRATYFKWSVALILGVLAFIFGKSCNCNGGKAIVKTDTISVRHDTVIHSIDSIVSFVPAPYMVIEHDTLETDGPVTYYPIDKYPSAIQKMLTEYNATKYYRDSLQLRYGKVYVADTLRWNRITGQSITANLSIPEITNTITLQTQAPRRITGYIGGELIGNKGTPFYMAGLDLGIMGKKQKIFIAKAALDKNGNVWYGGQYLIPIRLHK